MPDGDVEPSAATLAVSRTDFPTTAGTGQPLTVTVVSTAGAGAFDAADAPGSSVAASASDGPRRERGGMRTVGRCGVTGSLTDALAGDDTDRPPPDDAGGGVRPDGARPAIASALGFRTAGDDNRTRWPHPLASSHCMPRTTGGGRRSVIAVPEYSGELKTHSPTSTVPIMPVDTAETAHAETDSFSVSQSPTVRMEKPTRMIRKTTPSRSIA